MELPWLGIFLGRLSGVGHDVFFQAVAFGLGASFLWTSEDGYF